MLHIRFNDGKQMLLRFLFGKTANPFQFRQMLFVNFLYFFFLTVQICQFPAHLFFFALELIHLFVEPFFFLHQTFFCPLQFISSFPNFPFQVVFRLQIFLFGLQEQLFLFGLRRFFRIFYDLCGPCFSRTDLCLRDPFSIVKAYQ